MPMHNGWLPREGFTADVVFKLIGKTALNPAMMLPLVLLARFTKKGENMSILHPTAYSRIKTLLYIGVARWLNNYYSRRAINNFKADKYDWSKEIVLVTGGAGGIGGHVVQMLAERGIKVVVLDIQPLTFTAGANVHYFKCDITSPAQLSAVASAIRQQVGDPTVLINNAGVARGKSLLAASERDVRFTFDVNVLAHCWTAREFVPAMARANHGMIVTVASFASWLSVSGMADYSATKAAARALHEGLVCELADRHNAPRVRNVLVFQGFTRTSLFEGYDADSSPFLVPALHPESVAQAIVEQVLSGQSGQVVMPSFGNALSALAAMPLWYQTSLRSKNKGLMANFRGRQVVEDLDTFYAEKERGAAGTEESTVLVAGSEET